MFKLVFLFVVLVAVVAANAHPQKPHPKKASAGLQKQHHGLDLHGHGPAAKRIVRSHNAHGIVHHTSGGSAGAPHHSNKIGGGSNHGGAHKGGSKKGAAAHRPVKHRGHRK